MCIYYARLIFERNMINETRGRLKARINRNFDMNLTLHANLFSNNVYMYRTCEAY